MSELKVDKITPRLGTTLTLGDSGDTINFGSGVLPNFENLTVTGDLTVDTNSLKVDSTNNFVGIGTATPAVALDVVGAITATGNITGTLATAAQPNITSLGTLTGLTTTGDINLGDSDKANFGASNDLQIYHTGVDSFIRDAGTGNLRIQATNFKLENSGATQSMIEGYDGGAVDLRYAGSTRLYTTTDGVFITGGIQMTADLDMGDNDKILLGSSDDLEIFHDGSNSYIKDVGTGNLFIDAQDLRLRGSNGEKYAVFIENGSSTLYYDDAEKLATTTTGIDVTGKTTTDSIDAVGSQSGSTPIVKIENSVGDNLVSFKRTTGTPSDEYAIGADSASLHFKNSTLSTYIMSLSEGGDISFYEDTGTTAKFFWDASAERLKIGDSSSNTVGGLVVGSDSGGVITVTKNGGTYAQNDLIGSLNWYTEDASLDGPNVTAKIAAFASGVSGDDAYLTFYTTAQPLGADAAESMRINSSGNVGIGETSPDTKLHVKAGSAGTETAFTNSVITLENNTDCRLQFLSGSSNVGEIMFGDGDLNRQGRLSYDHSVDAMKFETTNAERMRIDSSGNVGIKNSSPSHTLDISDTSTTAKTLRVGQSSGVSNADATMIISNGGTGDAMLRFDYEGSNTDRARLGTSSSGQNLLFFTAGNNERMRITSSGDLVIGKTDPAFNNTAGVAIRNFNAIQVERANACLDLNRMNTNGDIVIFYRGATNVVGTISGTASSVSYNTSSDYRLKENVVDLTSATDRLKQLSPKRFNFIADADTTVDGFLAHEVQSVVPEAITGTKDEVNANGNPVYQGIDQSKLVPLLVATIKELEARIEALENA
jgi:hypothetical protein